MVTFLCFLEKYKVFIQKRFLRECDTIYTGKLRTFLVSSPICTCDGCHLHGLDEFRISEVRSTAEIGKIAILVECNLAVLEFADKFELVLVTFLREIFYCIFLGDMGAFELLLTACKFQHLLLDSREIRVGKLLSAKVNVIIESVFDSRSDTELHTRIKGFESLCHKVGRRVPENMFSFLVFPFQQPYGAVLLNRCIQSDYRTFSD